MCSLYAGIVKNGDFSQWQDGKPVGWNLQGGHYAPETRFKRSGQYSLRMETDPAQKTLWLNNTLTQPVTLKPGANYVLKIVAAKESTGTFQFNLFPLVNGKRGKAVVTFRRWVWGFPFDALNRNFQAGAGTEYLLEIKHFGNADGACYLDSVSIAEKPSPGQEKAAGIYGLSSMYFFDGAVPDAAYQLENLDFINCRNETESTVVLWKTDAPQKDVTLKLKSIAGIPADAVTVRDLIDSVLPISEPRAVGAGETAAWQIFVKTTPEIKAGNYRAVFELTASGKTVREIPASITVADIVLPPADIAFWVYHNETYMPAQFITPELREKYYRDIAEHGMNTISLYNNPHHGTEADFSKNYSGDPKLIPAKFRDWNPKNDPDERYNPKQWQAIFDFGLEAQMELAAKYGLVNKKYPIVWLITKLGNYNWGGLPPAVLQKALEQWQQRPNWPEPLLYVLDEPYDLPDRIAAALAIFNNLEKHQVNVRTVTAHPHPDILGKYYDVWILSSLQVNLRNAQKALEQKRELWYYNCNVPNTNAAFYRAMHGFWALQNNLKGIAAWAYYDARNHFIGATDASAARLSRVGLTPDGPIPTAAWEATREGTEDYRLGQYYYELMAELEQCKQKLLDAASKTLSQQSMANIRKRETDKFRKFDPKRVPVEWKPQSEAEAAAEKMFLEYLNLENMYNQSKQAFRLFDAIGTLAPLHRGIDEDVLRSWHPDLGENNAPDDAEVKRRILLPYVLRLQEKLQ